MYLEYHEHQFPELSKFRKACLAEQFDVMEIIAKKNHDWYRVENPEDLSMARLAKVFQAQQYASEGMISEFTSLARDHAWVINHPWTIQRWLPLSQAAHAGYTKMVATLLEMGADSSLMVGDAGEKCSIIELARQSGHEEIAELIERVSEFRLLQ